jgi:hypothetical protein
VESNNAAESNGTVESSAAVVEPAFADPSTEETYQAARSRLIAPSTSGPSGSVWLVLSLVAFAALELVQRGSISNLVLLVAVLLFHELGHYVGMVALGYRDVRMFFIPLFGAAVSGRRGGGSQTREAIVLLLGPVPGIVFGASAAVAAVVFHSMALKTVAEYLIGINLLNLLPVIPLDGGRLGSVILFSRWRRSEALFVGGTLATVIGFCATHGAWVFAGGAFFLLLLLPVQLRMSKMAARLRDEGLPPVSDPAALDDRSMRALFMGVTTVMPKATGKIAADWMGQVLEMASRRAPSVGRSLAVLAVWAVSFGVGLFALMLVALLK